MKTTFLAAAVTLAAATMAQAGSTPVISGVPVTITLDLRAAFNRSSSITIQTVTGGENVPVIGSVPVFFYVVAPPSPGGFFTFRLVRN